MRARTRIVSAAALPLAAALAMSLIVERGGPAGHQSSGRAPTSPADMHASSALVGSVPGSGTTPIEAIVDSWVVQLDAGRAVIEELEFIAGSDTLAKSADALLTGLAGALTTARGTFLVEAHAAPSGDVIADQWLTDRRAAAVRTRLIAAGVPAGRLFAMGFGATRPTRASGHAVTSRIEISRMP